MGKKKPTETTIVVMKPSLDLLKKLNDIPDLADRLALATTLCNHGHRADMIFRWLAELLTVEETLRSEPEAWKLITRSIRLLSNARVSSLVQTHHIPKLIEQALRGSVLRHDCLLVQTIDGLLQVLLTSTAPSELSITTVISLEAEEAASLFDALLTAALDHNRSEELPNASFFTVVGTAIDIWSARRTSPAENTIFEQNCWYTAGLVYAKAQGSIDNLRPLKRKHPGEGQTMWNAKTCSAQLESIAARHIYLPCRKAFFALASAGAKDTGLFKPNDSFSNQVASDIKVRPETWNVLPTQLDVAIRCASIITHHQKMKETVWIDAIFTAFMDLWIRLGGPSENRSTLLQMTNKVMERHALSHELSSRIVDLHCGLNTSDCDWALIARLVQMDDQLFSTNAFATRLFSTISSAFALGRQDNETRSHGSFMINQILLPICKAFALHRRLGDLLALWQEQIAQPRLASISPLWLDLDLCLEEVLESAMTTTKIQSEVELRTEQLMQLSSQLKKSVDDETVARFWAASTVLNALLRGIRQPFNKLTVAGRAGVILQVLLKACRAVKSSSAAQSVLSCSWALATAAFKLWFPKLAIDESTEVVDAKAKSLLKEKLLDLACQTVEHDAEYQSTSQAHVRQNSMSLVVCLCDALKDYDCCAEPAGLLLKRLADSSTQASFDILALHPSLTQLMVNSSNTARIIKPGSGLEQGRGSSIILPTLSSSTSAQGQSISIKALITTVRDSLGDSSKPELLLTLNETLRLPSSLFSKAQRGDLLDLLTSWQHKVGSNELNSIRLALLAKHVSSAASHAALVDDAETIWHLCEGIDFPNLPAVELVTLTELISTVVASVFRRWMLTADLHTSRENLQAATATAVKVLSHGLVDIEQSSLSSVIVATAVVRGVLESSSRGKDAISLQYVTTVAEQLLGQINRTIESFLPRNPSELSSNHIDSMLLCMFLDAGSMLVQMTDSSLTQSTPPKDLQSLATKIMTKFSPEPWTGDEDVSPHVILTAPAVHAYCVLTLDRTQELALLSHAACRLLSVTFSPKICDRLRTSYRQAAQARDADAKITMVASLIDTKNTELRPSSFDIINETLLAMSDSSKEIISAHPAILATILKLIRTETRYAVVRGALSSVSLILRHNVIPVNQYEIDLTLGTIHLLAKPSAVEVLLFPDLCAAITALLTHHRTRLNGRFHILIPVLQALQARLLSPRLAHLRQGERALGKHHADSFARVVTLMCEPPASSARLRQQSTTGNDLVDRARRARANVGSFVQPILHSYCALVLRSPPRADVREALLPAIASMLSTMEVFSSESIKVLSSAISDGERGILRGLVDQWQLTGRWSGI